MGVASMVHLTGRGYFLAYWLDVTLHKRLDASAPGLMPREVRATLSGF